MRKYIKEHSVKALQSFEETMGKGKYFGKPLDIHIKDYLKPYGSLGSRDRKLIKDKIYEVVRHRGMLLKLSKGELDFNRMIDLLDSNEFKDQRKNPSFEEHVRCSFPKELYTRIARDHGEHKAFNICETLNGLAPITIRANPMKVSRDQVDKTKTKLMTKLKNEYKFKLKRTQFSPLGLTFLERPGKSLGELEEFEKGLFEPQDEASQLVALQVDCMPGQQVLDFCAGSGGKSLAFGPFMKNLGQLYLHDVREAPLIEAKKRFAKSGMTNVQFHCGEENLRKCTGRFDWLVLDVPCTGTGTIRRNPDLKWKFSEDSLKNLVSTQREIFQNAMKYLKPNGKILYSTCSILSDENEKQIEHFVKDHKLKLWQNKYFQSLPVTGGQDGFFSALLTR